MADCLLTDSDHCSDGSHREFVQANVLDRGPDNREATGLGRKHVNLVGALAHIDFPDSQWHWSSEYADAWSEGTRKT
jgi:hypothetical protein